MSINIIVHEHPSADDWLDTVASYLSEDGWQDLLICNGGTGQLGSLSEDYKEGHCPSLDRLIRMAKKEKDSFPIIVLDEKDSMITYLNLAEVKKRYQEIVC